MMEGEGPCITIKELKISKDFIKDMKRYREKAIEGKEHWNMQMQRLDLVISHLVDAILEEVK